MDIKKLHIFILCAKYRNFSRVAELTYSTQSTISKCISALEDEVGGKLFVRTTRRIELTSLGEAIIPYAESLCQTDDDLHRTIQQQLTGRDGTFVIGIAANLTNTPVNDLLKMLSSSVAELRHLYSDLDVTITSFRDSDLPTLMSSGRVDLALMAMNNDYLHKSVYPDLEFLRLDLTSNYLVYHPIPGVPDTIEDILPRLPKLISYHDQIAMGMTMDFVQKAGSFISCESGDNWLDILLRVLNREGGTITGETTARLALEQGLCALALDSMNIYASLAAFWAQGKNLIAGEMAVIMRNILTQLRQANEH